MTPSPTMTGIIERRLLVNYRADPLVAGRLLPGDLAPHLVDGWAVVGVCLIRLGQLRPIGIPAALGITTENAAHRIAVQWRDRHGARHGVYIPRRDTSSRLTTLLGGRVFPGEHYRARFSVHETEGHYDVAFRSLDGSAHVAVIARRGEELAPGSVFGSIDEASDFFRVAPLGYSATRSGDLEGMELRCARWKVEPLVVDRVASSLFEDPAAFPAGSLEFDSALIMRSIPATWHARGRLRRGERAADAAPATHRVA